MHRRFLFLATLTVAFASSQTPLPLHAAERPLKFRDRDAKRYTLQARASEIDPKTKEHPELNFTFTNPKDGKPADMQNASVDTRVEPKGKLVIWLMGHNGALFERLNKYGIHAIQVSYANGWFSKFGNSTPGDDGQLLGHIRLEASTGEDHSPLVNIPEPDSIKGRAFEFVKWLAKENPQGQWDYFIADDKKGLRWDRVILSGASHGATTAARFAKHQAVDRVVMFCGPRDQHETWQGLESATEGQRYFGFSHVLDGGWSGDHYCRSWELMNLNQYGPIVNVDKEKAPFGNSRRLITDADVNNDEKRAHSCVTPGKSAIKVAGSEELAHEVVWEYLFTHPVDEVGKPVPPDDDCRKVIK